jgi:hypothetical protein
MWIKILLTIWTTMAPALMTEVGGRYAMWRPEQGAQTIEIGKASCTWDFEADWDRYRVTCKSGYTRTSDCLAKTWRAVDMDGVIIRWQCLPIKRGVR